MTRLRATLVAAGALTATSLSAVAQTPDSTAVRAGGSCVLEWGAPPGERAPVLRHTEGESGEVADFFSGRTLFTCGTATMLADSAVSYETRGEVVMVGNVAYRDSLRSLESERLTYYERIDLVVAEEDVVLVRTADRSTLEGPRVEFLRAVSGVDELTTATGRPHMTLYPEGEDPGPPFEVDADRTVFAGQDEARAYGNVVIDRDDLRGEADSVRLRRTEETGEMWGDPWIEAEGVRLEGDVIDFRSREDVLEEIHARGDGRAVGESFEVRAMVIDIALVDEQPERVWAHGPGLSRALSGAHNVYGDSLDFAMFEGSIDTVYAIGEAIALTGEPDDPQGAVTPTTTDSTGAAAGDSLMTMHTDSLGVSPSLQTLADSLGVPASFQGIAAPAADSLGVSLDSLVSMLPDSVTVPQGLNALAAAGIDSLAAMVADPAAVDSTASAAAGPVVVDSAGAPSDTAAVDSLAVAAPADTLPVAPADATSDSTAVAEGAAETDSAAGGTIPAPRLRITGDATWIRGDTVIAVFERPAADSAAAATLDSLANPPPVSPIPAPADTSGRTVAEAALGSVDSLVVIEPEPPAADTADDPVMEKLIAIGNARSLFSQVRDSTVSRRESKNYMIGKRIEILFEDGEPTDVHGVEAIGVFLDPMEEGAPVAGAPAAGATTPDSLAVPSDSLAAPPDSLTVPPDTLAAPPDSLAAAPDTLAIPPDTASAPPDTTALARALTPRRRAPGRRR
ncbi:MAG: hypothetical protein R3195_09085 [Gemmatimonadota bacterium]|nr:hypothetical protein [Gemmatimonadota bacterium]